MIALSRRGSGSHAIALSDKAAHEARSQLQLTIAFVSAEHCRISRRAAYSLLALGLESALNARSHVK